MSTNPQQVWYYAANNTRMGPVGLRELAVYVTLSGGPKTYVFGPGLSEWTHAAKVPAIAEAAKALQALPPQSLPPDPKRVAADFKYKIDGQDHQTVELRIAKGKSVLIDPATILYLGSQIGLKPSQRHGRFAVATNIGQAPAIMALSAPSAGSIVALDLGKLGGRLVVQQQAVMAGGLELVGHTVTARLATHLSGQATTTYLELQDIDSPIILFAQGALKRIDLGPTDRIRLGAEKLLALSASIRQEMEYSEAAANTGKGLVFTTLTGPGTVWLQTQTEQVHRQSDVIVPSAAS
jgi:uncharacterized protein (AIM24 family)